MTSKEIITRVIEHNNPPRIGFDFSAPYPSDFKFIGAARLMPEYIYPREYYGWGVHKGLQEIVPWFRGEVMADIFGNIYGRLNGITKGECIKGFLDDWSKLEKLKIPAIDVKYYDELKQQLKACEQFAVAVLPMQVFSNLRDIRLMDNALMDTLLEPEKVEEFLEIVIKMDIQACEYLRNTGADAVMFFDDWGTQDRTFISPAIFEKLFKPSYKKICEAAHAAGLKVFMHSCGKNNGIVGHLAEAGIDVFQFDQPNVYPISWLAENFGSKATFYLPVDIQKVMPTGDRELIERNALDMVNAFKAVGGALIAKDYSPWSDINVKEEWATWARDIIIKNAELN